MIARGDSHRRTLRGALADRHGGDGRRVPGARPAAGAPGGGQAAAPSLRRGSGVRRALPPRGVERGGPVAPERRGDLRPRGVGRHVLHRDGVPAGALAEDGGARAGSAGPVERDRRRRADPARGALRARARRDPPRPEAAQRDPRRGGAGEGHRLRDRAGGRLGHDADGLDHGHGAVPLAGAGAGPGGERGLGPVRGGDRAVRAADRRGALRRGDGGDDRAQAGLGDPAAAERAEPGGAAGARRGGGACAGEGSGGALRRRGRVPRGARVRAAAALRRGELRAGRRQRSGGAGDGAAAAGRARARGRAAGRGGAPSPALVDRGRGAARAGGGRGAGRAAGARQEPGDGAAGYGPDAGRRDGAADRGRAHGGAHADGEHKGADGYRVR